MDAGELTEQRCKGTLKSNLKKDDARSYLCEWQIQQHVSHQPATKLHMIYIYIYIYIYTKDNYKKTNVTTLQ